MTEPSDLQPTRYGAYLLLDQQGLTRGASQQIGALARELGFINEYDVELGHPEQASAVLKREHVVPGTLDDPRVEEAHWIVHAACPSKPQLQLLISGAQKLLPAESILGTLSGVVRPRRYTSAVIDRIAYRNQLQQRGAELMPICFFHPMSKTEAWWHMDPLEQQTFFLPRYESGRKIVDGHVLASAEGVAAMMRRTYRSETEPSSPDEYDFLNYFECSEADEPVFHSVLAALRNTGRNPEWAFVSEGPLWKGRRVRTMDELVA